MADAPGGKRAVFLAAEIEREIQRLGWPVGEVLGGEEALCQRYGVSRAVLREAIRILESRWVARMRPGPGGGLVVTAPDASVVGDVVGMYLGYRQASRADLAETWVALGVAAVARLAAAPGDAVDPLREALDSGDAVRVHATIAALGGNPAMQLFLDVVAPMTLRQAAGADAGVVTEQHAVLVDAIAAGDAGAAEECLRRCVATLAG